MENVIEKVSELLSKLTFLPTSALQLAFVGIILLIVLFALAVAISCFSNIKGLSKKILGVIANLATLDTVDEDNVEMLNVELQKLPEAVGDGWGRFMEQRLGYPSDYMKENSVLDENTYSTKSTIGKIFFRIFGFLAVALIVTLSTLVLADDAANLGLNDFLKDFKVVGGIVGAIALPLFFYIALETILIVIYRKQRRRLQLLYKSFMDTLDEKVVIFASEEEEFVSDNLEKIAQNIEEMIAQRMDNNEAVEVITAPQIEEFEKNEIVEEVEEEQVLPEIIEEEVVATAPISKEEQQNYLVVLISIVESAIADPEVKMEELEEIAELIYGSLEAFSEKEDQAILEECLEKIAVVFFGEK